jgi:hypothetical protein
MTDLFETQPFKSFLQEKQFLKNVTPKTTQAYKVASDSHRFPLVTKAPARLVMIACHHCFTTFKLFENEHCTYGSVCINGNWRC